MARMEMITISLEEEKNGRKREYYKAFCGRRGVNYFAVKFANLRRIKSVFKWINGLLLSS